VGLMGTLLKNRRAGEAQLAWNLPGLAGPDTLILSSTAFGEGEAIPQTHAGKRAGGANLSPDLAWSGVPSGTARLLLVVEDTDSPTSRPFVHCVALIDPALSGVGAGDLVAPGKRPEVQVLKSGMGTGYRGPEPIKGHGPHNYVFQLFALASDLPAELSEARPSAVLAAAGPVLARARLSGTYER
jgi:phosphatidylethanolamine-binding protein (PEBP) family uncharacterized protein